MNPIHFRFATAAAPLAALALLALFVPRLSRAAGAPTPPVARRIPMADTTLGDVRTDDYSWLRDRKNPETIAYLEAENAYTKARMAHTEGLQEALYQELLGRIKETDLSVPAFKDGYFYYTRTVKGLQYPIHCRKKGNLEAPEEVLLDENLDAGKDAHYAIGAFEVSPNHKLLAYTTDRSGAERYTLVVKNLETGQVLPDHIGNLAEDVHWANDNITLFYDVADSANRPYRLYRHKLGTDPSKDDLVLEETDPLYNLGLSRSRSGSYLFVTMDAFGSTEVHYLSADAPDGKFQVIRPRAKGLEYGVDHSGGFFYIRTNDGGATNFKVSRAPVTDPSRWEPFIEYRPDALVDRILAFKGHLVVAERKDALRQLHVYDLNTRAEHFVPFEESVFSVSPSVNPEFNTGLLRFEYTSLVTPRSVYDYDMAGKTRELKKATEVLGGYDPSLYATERSWATAADGKRVPISLVYRKPLVKDGKRPMLLYAYGSYGLSTDPSFNSGNLTLLDRGYVYAIAHIRGGEELGREWYDNGKLLNKKNTFTDFIACAEHLIKEKYTSSDRLAIRGGSAGGLLMGAVVNMRPELFKAVVADVPFVDLINTMKDASIPLTTQEWEQWGNPNEAKYYGYMKSYSPYDNVEPKAYPNMLITAGLNDPRVGYWEPAKWTARLRALKTDKNTLLLKVNMGAGHGGASGRYDALRDIALRYAFLFDVMGIQAQPARAAEAAKP